MIIESKCLRMVAPPTVALLLLLPLLVLVGRCCLYIYSRKTGIRKHNNQLHGFKGAVARRGSTGRSPRAHFLPPSPTNTSATQTTLSFPQNTFPSSRPPNTTAPTVESAFPLFSAPRPTLKLSTTHRHPATWHLEPREPAVRQGNPLVSI